MAGPRILVGQDLEISTIYSATFLEMLSVVLGLDCTPPEAVLSSTTDVFVLLVLPRDP